MRPDGRMGHPATLAELLAKNGGAVIGDPEKLRCPHCGGDARLIEVTTPRLGWVLQFWAPPFTCCARARQKARV